MARAYSLDLRERVVGAVAAGQPCRAVASTFGVSVASVVKWSQRFRATGSAAALKVGGRRPFALAGERSWLPCSAKPPSEPSRQPGNASVNSSTNSLQPSAPTTSPTLDTLQRDPITL